MWQRETTTTKYFVLLSTAIYLRCFYTFLRQPVQPLRLPTISIHKSNEVPLNDISNRRKLHITFLQIDIETVTQNENTTAQVKWKKKNFSLSCRKSHLWFFLLNSAVSDIILLYGKSSSSSIHFYIFWSSVTLMF